MTEGNLWRRWRKLRQGERRMGRGVAVTPIYPKHAIVETWVDFGWWRVSRFHYLKMAP